MGQTRKAEAKPASTRLTDATSTGDLASELRALAEALAEKIDACKGHGMAGMSEQYRETVLALHALEEPDMADDPIARMVDAHRKKRADAPNLRAV